ncbi:MAG: hypothetical protein HMLKMBBP_02618 [Planctomycetes bacterium]|nr:hypothetical protein [Planctomycetota bacterium]
MSRFFGTMRCIVLPAVSRERAVEIVRAECERRGIPWRQPVTVSGGLLCYSVFLGGGSRGSMFVKVDKRDGRIRHVGIPKA